MNYAPVRKLKKKTYILILFEFDPFAKTKPPPPLSPERSDPVEVACTTPTVRGAFSTARAVHENVRGRIRPHVMGDIDSAFWVRPFQIMEWSNEASLALIDEYKKHPVLWDVRHQSYSSKSLKQEAWETIAASMQLDVQEVKQKMNSLLGSFRREKSKMRKNRETFNGTYGYLYMVRKQMGFFC